MASIKDDRGYNQGFALGHSTIVRMQRRAEWMMSEMHTTPETSVLEIGCGTGEIAHWIAEKIPGKVLGTDLCVPFIDSAKKKFVLPNLRYAVLDFNNAAEMQGEHFDYIIGNGILHHLYDNLDTALVSLFALLKPHGKIIFLEPNLYNPYVYLIFSFPTFRKIAHLEPDEMAFTKTYITDKLVRAGYGDIYVQYRDFLLPGIPDLFITPSIVVGDVIEQVPLLRSMSQSIFICATKK